MSAPHQQALLPEKGHEGALVAEAEDPAYEHGDSFMVSSQKAPQSPAHYALPPDQVT